MVNSPSRLLSKLVDEKRALVTCPGCNKGHVTAFFEEGKTLYIYCDECMSKWEDFPTIGGHQLRKKENKT
jgi:hypothetical protein